MSPDGDLQVIPLQTAAGERSVALFAPARGPNGERLSGSTPRPAILFFYGNGDSASGTRTRIEQFRRLGAHVMVPEYIGYGMSEGKPDETKCYAVADAAYLALRRRKEVDPNRIVISGWSLGGAVAIDLASRRPSAGLAAFSTFTSMGDMARHRFGFEPFGRWVRHRFESERKIRRVKCPILLGHGDRDGVVPCTMSESLARAAGGKVTAFIVAGASHNDFFTKDEQRVMKEMRRWMKDL